MHQKDFTEGGNKNLDPKISDEKVLINYANSNCSHFVMRVNVCVCMCVCVRKRDGEGEREERERDI